MANAIDTLNKHRRIETVDDERMIGNGVIVTLKKGWSFDPLSDNRVAGEDTPTKILTRVRHAHSFSGPFDD
jgi:hypothetical protein